MNPIRKTFLKLAAALFLIVLVMSIWKFGAPWKLYLWAAIGVCLLFAFVTGIGALPHRAWRAFVDRSSQGMRFFLGAGIVTGLVAFYQTQYVTPVSEITWPPTPGAYRWWALAAAVCLLAGAIRPVADALFGAWMAFAHLLQSVMSRVILTIVYILAVLPVGLIAKLVGKRFLDKELDPQRASYWIDRPRIEFDQRRYRRHF